MSTQTLSTTQIGQLRQMLLEHGLEEVFFGLGEIAKQKRLKGEGHPEEGKYAKQTKKQTKTQIRKNKKMIREAKAEELAEKIKATHDIDVNPTEFTLNALNKILRTGEMQEKRKKKGKNGYMRFLTQERVENKKRTEPIPSNELLKLTGQKWRDMTDEQKAVWKTTEPTAEKQAEEPTAEKEVEEQKKAPKATKVPKMKKAELKIHLTEQYGWDAKLLCKFTITELLQAKETGELPTEAMERRKDDRTRRNKKKHKKKHKSKKAEEAEEAEAEAEAEEAEEADAEEADAEEPDLEGKLELLRMVPQTTDENPPSMFDMSDSEDEDESN